jgi:hypothetical protein
MEELVEAVILAGACTMRLGHSGTLVPPYVTGKDVRVGFGVERVR